MLRLCGHCSDLVGSIAQHQALEAQEIGGGGSMLSFDSSIHSTVTVQECCECVCVLINL